MGVLTTGNTFSTGDQVTASKLNDAVNSATFQPDAVDNITTQLIAVGGVSNSKIVVKDLGITQDKIASDAVGTNQLANDVVVNTSGSITGAAGSFTTLAASGVVSVPDGSESAPAITNTGDTNTGIYFPAENSVALTAGAGATLTSTNTAITIDVSTSIVSTAQSDLTLQGGDANSKNLIFKKASAQQGKISAVGDELKFYAGTSATETLELTTTEAVVTGDLTVDTTTLKVDSTNNRVGIGTASPALPLDVNGSARVAGTFFVGTDDTDPNGLLEVYGGGTGQNEGGEIHLRTAADFDSTYNHYFIDAYQDDLRIGRAGGADITLNSTGNVGIGTTTPAHKLEVNGNAIIGDDTTGNVKINSISGDSAVGSGNVHYTFNGNEGTGLRRVAANTLALDTASEERLRIDLAGNVGIGTPSPSAPLEVASTTGGVIMPRMTTTQKNAISSPTNGEMVYDTTDNKFYGYANGSWVAFH